MNVKLSANLISMETLMAIHILTITDYNRLLQSNIATIVKIKPSAFSLGDTIGKWNNLHVILNKRRFRGTPIITLTYKYGLLKRTQMSSTFT